MKIIRNFIYSLCLLIPVFSQVVFADGTSMLLGGPVEIATDMLPFGCKGDEYSAQIRITGGSGEFIFHPTALPSGLSLKESGRLEGRIESDIGKHPFRIIVSDTLNEAELYEKPLTLTVFEKPAFSTEEMPPAVNGNKYTHNVAITGGSGEYIFHVTELPKGLFMDETGLISGIPDDIPGSNTIQLSVSDTAFPKKIIQKEFMLDLYQPVAITAAVLPIVKKHQQMEAIIKTEGGSGELSFSAENLPKGLKISKFGKISGAVILPRGEYTFRVLLTDKKAHTSIKKQFQLTVVDFFPDDYETLNDNEFTSSNMITPGSPIQQHTFHHTGDRDYIKLDLTKITPGNIIDVQTGRLTQDTSTFITLFGPDKSKILTGTATNGDKYSRLFFECTPPGLFYILVDEATVNVGDYSISVIDTGPKVKFKTERLPAILKKGNSRFQLEAVNGSGRYFFSAVTLPGKLSISDTGLLAINDGTGLEKGEYSFSVRIEDSSYPGVFTEKELTLTVVDFFPDQYETAGDNGFQTSNIIKPDNVFQYHTFNHAGDVDYLALDLTDVAKGNVLHITTSINTTSTKTVLTVFDAQQKALISDRKIARPSYSSLYFKCPAPDVYYLKAEENNNHTGDYGLTITDKGPAVRIVTESIPDALAGGNYSLQPEATDGSGDYRFKAAGLPKALSMDNTGLISGTMSVPSGSYSFSLTVDDAIYTGTSTKKIATLHVVDFYPDSFEANTDNDFATTNTLLPGNTQKHNFNFPGDEDFIRLDLSKAAPGDLIIIESSKMTKLTDTTFVLYNEWHNEINTDDNSGNGNYAKLVFQCFKPGVYFLKITGPPKMTGDYSISMGNSGQPLKFATQTLPLAESLEPYMAKVKVAGGCGKVAFFISDGKLPQGLVLGAETGILSGENKAWGSFRFTLTAKDQKFPENQAKQEYIIDAYIGKKLSGTESIDYPFYVNDTLGVDDSLNSITAVPSDIKGGTPGNLRYKIISHNIPDKRFQYKFNSKTAGLTLKEAAPMACSQYQNLYITVNIEVKDIIHSNNTMTFQYQIPAKCLMY